MKRIGIVAFLSLLIVGCGSSPEVEMVKNGSLTMCENTTIEEMVDGFMGSPSWDSGKSSGGQSFVNIEGDITFSDKPVRALLQFMVNEDEGSFNFNAIEFNDIPQNKLLAMGMLKKMCESAN